MFPLSTFSSTSEVCGVCVGKNANKTTHCGFLFAVPEENGKGKKCYFLHLGSPLNLFTEQEKDTFQWKGYISQNPNYQWKPFANFPSQLKNLITSACVLISENNEALPYGLFHSEGTQFDKFGKIHLGEDSDGLTCGTFVKIVLSNSGVDIIDNRNWPDDRADDLSWAENIIVEWNAGLKDLEVQLNDIRNRIRITNRDKEANIRRRDKIQGKIAILKDAILRTEDAIQDYFERYRPEEVASASYFDFQKLPLNFDYPCGCPGVKILGEDLYSRLPVQQ